MVLDRRKFAVTRRGKPDGDFHPSPFSVFGFRFLSSDLVQLDKLVDLFHELVLRGDQLNPVVDQSRPLVVNHLRTQLRHVAGSAFRNTQVEHRSKWLAGRDDFCVVDAERALSRPRVDGFHLAQRHVEADVNASRAASVKTMAVSTVRVKIRAAPVGQTRRLVSGVGEGRQVRSWLRLLNRSEQSRRVGSKVVFQKPDVTQ